MIPEAARLLALTLLVTGLWFGAPAAGHAQVLAPTAQEASIYAGPQISGLQLQLQPTGVTPETRPMLTFNRTLTLRFQQHRRRHVAATYWILGGTMTAIGGAFAELARNGFYGDGGASGGMAFAIAGVGASMWGVYEAVSQPILQAGHLRRMGAGGDAALGYVGLGMMLAGPMLANSDALSSNRGALVSTAGVALLASQALANTERWQLALPDHSSGRRYAHWVERGRMVPYVFLGSGFLAFAMDPYGPLQLGVLPIMVSTAALTYSIFWPWWLHQELTNNGRFGARVQLDMRPVLTTVGIAAGVAVLGVGAYALFLVPALGVLASGMLANQVERELDGRALRLWQESVPAQSAVHVGISPILGERNGVALTVRF